MRLSDRLRMLAIFSLQEWAGALNLGKERFELARLINNLAKVNKAIELLAEMSFEPDEHTTLAIHDGLQTGR